jgi:hypothetical protein
MTYKLQQIYELGIYFEILDEGRQITVCGLTGLALLASNVIKTQNFISQSNSEGANSGQVRVETVVMLLSLYTIF